MTRHLLPLSVVLLIAILPAAATGASPESTEQEPAQLLDEREQGVEAVLALGDDLPVAAARNDMAIEELRGLLMNDATAGVDRSGLLYFAEPLPSPVPDTEDAPVQAQAGTVDVDADVFALESLPGAPRAIYIDFDGHDVTGTAWNDSVTGWQAAFDRDGSPSTFNDGERALIADIWAQVAEDYAPFAVNVTTKDPGFDAIHRTDEADEHYGTRALVTSNPDANRAICMTPCSGVAYLNVFNTYAGAPGWHPGVASDHDRYQPAAWVFSNEFPGTGPALAKALAETVSHEVGHTLDLLHAGRSDGTTYYPGHGAWAPIMGNSLDRPISQWSKGEYPDARSNYFGQVQPSENELERVLYRGLSLRDDDHGGTISGATELTGSSVLRGTGVISFEFKLWPISERSADLDVFRFSQPCDGTIDVVAAPAPVAPNLDIGIRLLDSAGVELASADPPSSFVSALVADGLGASLSLSRPAGTYYVEVDGVGAGTLAEGYSDYDSLGSYSLEIAACEPQPPAPQVISFTSTPPAPAVVGGTYTPSAVGGGSGQPVVISIGSTGGACAIAVGVITFTDAGTCEVHADQDGSAAFEPAVRVTQTIAVTPIECAAGTYRSGTAATSCTPASAGSFVSAAGATAQELCPAGTYQPSEGASSCTSASAGSFVDVPGATAQTPCAAGSFQPATRQTSCQLAQPGFFVAAAGAAAQMPCPAGTESSAGATVCTSMAGGFNSNFDGSAVLRVKPKQAIPLQWAFPDGTTNRALLAGTVSLASVSSTRCTAAAGADDTETATTEGVTGASGLQLLADGSYQVNWKATTTTGCRALTVTAPYAASSGFSGSWSRTILVDIRK